MNNSQDITITEGRARQAIDNTLTEFAMPKVKEHVKYAVESERIRTGVITKFYPYLDKAEVKLNNVNKTVLCKILHRYGGELLDCFTPLAEKTDFCNELNEPYVVPRVKQNVCVLNINDKDSEENLILGYFQKDDIVGFNPASPGNLKIVARSITNDYYIKFGLDGLSYKTPKEISAETGVFEDDMTPVDYASSDNVYTKDEVYTKEEVDELIAAKIAEALEQLNEE